MKIQKKTNKDTLNSIFSSSKGFTLLELLVVVLIIGILAAIALPQYKRAVYKSRYGSLMSLVNTIYRAEESYFLTNNAYTQDLTALDIDLSGCNLSNNKKSCTFDWGHCVLSFSNSNGSVGDGVICYRTKGLQNAYVYYFRLQNPYASPRMCFAKGNEDSNNIWNQVCKDVGAKFWVAGGDSNLGSINLYKF